MRAHLPLLVLALSLSPSAFTQTNPAAPTFQAGEWQVSSTVTPAVGQPVHRQVSVCANSADQAWQNSTPNATCSKPSLTAIPGGYTITLACSGGGGPVQWSSNSTIHETFSKDGSGFQANGSTTTTVSYAGQPPMTTSGTIQSTGSRVGDCK